MESLLLNPHYRPMLQRNTSLITFREILRPKPKVLFASDENKSWLSFVCQKAKYFGLERYFLANTRLESNIFSLLLLRRLKLKSIEHSNAHSQVPWLCVWFSISNTVFKVIERLFYLFPWIQILL